MSAGALPFNYLLLQCLTYRVSARAGALYILPLSLTEGHHATDQAVSLFMLPAPCSPPEVLDWQRHSPRAGIIPKVDITSTRQKTYGTIAGPERQSSMTCSTSSLLPGAEPANVLAFQHLLVCTLPMLVLSRRMHHL